MNLNSYYVLQIQYKYIKGIIYLVIIYYSNFINMYIYNQIIPIIVFFA